MAFISDVTPNLEERSLSLILSYVGGAGQAHTHTHTRSRTQEHTDATLSDSGGENKPSKSVITLESFAGQKHKKYFQTSSKCLSYTTGESSFI